MPPLRETIHHHTQAEETFIDVHPLGESPSLPIRLETLCHTRALRPSEVDEIQDAMTSLFPRRTTALHADSEEEVGAAAGLVGIGASDRTGCLALQQQPQHPVGVGHKATAEAFDGDLPVAVLLDHKLPVIVRFLGEEIVDSFVV